VLGREYALPAIKVDKVTMAVCDEIFFFSTSGEIRKEQNSINMKHRDNTQHITISIMNVLAYTLLGKSLLISDDFLT
jgi:hypothetical protein